MSQYKIFNCLDSIAEGWYWALHSLELRRGQVVPLTFLGKELAIYRGEDGKIVALDAYCPHMGAHLAEGRIEGNSLRCLFHYWKYAPNGHCTEIPALGGCPPALVRTSSWPVQEKYGLIWVWTGEKPRYPIPYVPELEGMETDSALGNRFVKNCHPNVVMINAIDAHHFNSVHKLPVRLEMKSREINSNCIIFSNITPIDPISWFRRLIKRFYKGPLTYSMSYWYGSTGTVTLGPDFLHFHIIFALRLIGEGKTEGQTILVTKRRKSLLGILLNRFLLFFTRVVGIFFANGDALIFRSIRFDLKTPIATDRPILQFIQHLESQKIASWIPSEKTKSVQNVNPVQPESETLVC